MRRFSQTAGPDGSCPRCHGSQFRNKRSKKAKTVGVLLAMVGAVTAGLLAGPAGVALGAVTGYLLAPKLIVECTTCGKTFKKR